MKREYNKPVVVKVKLNHEQAILGVCSSKAAGVISDATANFCHPSCKQSAKSGGTDSAASS